MNKRELTAFKEEVDRVLAERKAQGEYDANSKYMIFLLGNMSHLIAHAISQYPRKEKKT